MINILYCSYIRCNHSENLESRVRAHLCTTFYNFLWLCNYFKIKFFENTINFIQVRKKINQNELPVFPYQNGKNQKAL